MMRAHLHHDTSMPVLPPRRPPAPMRTLHCDTTLARPPTLLSRLSRLPTRHFLALHFRASRHWQLQQPAPMQSSTHTLYLERLYHRTALPSRHASRPLRPVLHRDRDTTAIRRTRSDRLHARLSCTILRDSRSLLLARHSARPPSSPSTTRASLDHRHSTTVLALARDTTARPRRHSSLLRHHRPRAPHHGTPSTGPFLDHATPDHDHGPTPRHEHPSRHEHSSDTRRPTIALLEPHDHDAQAARPRPAAAAAFAAARSMPGCAHDHRPRSRSRLGPHTSLHSLAHSLATLPA